LLYTDSIGNHLGYYNGEFMSEIQGAYKVELAEQVGSQFPETYYISNLDLKRELHGLTNGIANVSISKPNGLVHADVQVTPNSVDELSVPIDGSSIKFISGHGTSSLGLTLDQETAAIARVFYVDGFGVESGTSVQQLFSEDLNAAGFINNGARKNYNFYLEQIGLNPSEYINPIPIEIPVNSANWATPHDWNNLAHTYIELDQDIGNDGIVDNTKILTELQASTVITDIAPDTIKLSSKGQYITMYIQLPRDYNIRNMDIRSIQIITIQGRMLGVPIATAGPYAIGDYNYDGIKDLMVKFNRKSLTNILRPGFSEIGVIGKLLDGTYFSDTDVVRVLN